VKVSSTLYRAHTKFLCESQPIRIQGTGTSCEAQISQTGNESLTTDDFTNEPGDLSLWFTLEGITATVTQDGFLCPFSGTGTKTGGTFTSEARGTVTAASGTLQISGE